MGVQKAGPTLEGLAQRLEALERENGRMRSENDALRSKVATLEGSGTLRARDEESASELPESAGRVSRRQLLSRVGAAAAGLVVAGALTQRDIREARATPTKFTTNTANSGAVEGFNSNANGYGVFGHAPLYGAYGYSPDGTGVYGNGRIGVRGYGSGQAGVHGVNYAPTGYGVWGLNDDSGTGVRGDSVSDGADPPGFGVHGKGGNGVFGESSTPGQNGVWGKHTNQGAGVSGEGRVGVIGFSHENGWNAVWGRHTTNGRGVAGDSAQGVGVSGESTSGYGGQFKGGKAQLRLVPGSVAGKPTSGTHTKGEVYMDSKGTLFVCTAGDGTTVGRWKKVNMKLV